jgi:RNA polymerase sigma-70 factor (family 1)
MYLTLTDDVLLTLVRQDDSLALETIFNRYYKPLCDFCAVYTKDYAAAEEIVADLFIRIWDNRKDNAILKLRNYLFVSARNLALNHQKKRKTPIDYFEDLKLKEQDVTDTNTPFKILSNRESDGAILRLIDQLPARQREVLLMSRIDRLDKNMIALSLGISVRTVETTLYQAIHQLRMLMQQKQNFNPGS